MSELPAVLVWSDVLILVLLALNLMAVLALWLKTPEDSTAPDEARQRQWRDDLQRLEQGLRQELQHSAQATRSELLQGLGVFQQTLLRQSGELARRQNDSLQALALANERRLAEVRQTVEQQLAALQQGNERKLDQMRATVDEKLHATLEQRLGESFRQVAERLEQVHQGLGEMQGLARDVGSLHRVLTNVKTRGVFGEVQLAGLLEQVFAPGQYAANVETVPGTQARVEFAIRLPGRHDESQTVWLPIDAKFPREDYERLQLAQDAGDVAAAELAGRALESRLKLEARSIRERYLAPPHTTDFGILFLPTEGLYAEALRRPGLAEALQREQRILLAGPTTLLATLNSLQMGFRTLALERRSTEVWEVLGAVKSEFGKFGEVLARTRRKLEEASHSIEGAEVRTRAMARKLKSVETMPEPRAEALLGLAAMDGGDPDEGRGGGPTHRSTETPDGSAPNQGRPAG